MRKNVENLFKKSEIVKYIFGDFLVIYKKLFRFFSLRKFNLIQLNHKN
jgi:hypothetical protein